VEGFGRGWRHAMKQQLSLLLGGAPVLLLALYFKHSLAPVADPLVAQSFSDAVARAGEPGRFLTIAKAYWTEALAVGDGWYHPMLPVSILALGLRFGVSKHQRRWSLTAGLTLAAVLAGYFCAYLVTPNIGEAEILAEIEINDPAGMREACRKLYQLGVKNVLLKGGHLPGPAIDLLYDGKDFREYFSDKKIIIQ